MLLSVQTNIFAQLTLDPIKETLHPLPIPPCQNSGFESGNFSNWETFVGAVTPTTGGINLASFTQIFDPTQHQIVNANAIDNVGGFTQGNCGNKAAKVGDNVIGTDGRRASMIKYTFTVTPSNVNFSFRYALVLDDPNIITPGSHTPAQKPFIQYMLLQGNTHIPSSNLIISKKFVADGNNPFYTVLNNGIVYKDWSTECINLSAYMGQQVSFIFIEADCALSGHGAYGYLDCLCENNDAIANMTIDQEFCKDEPILMDGTASINEDSYFIGITKVPYTPGEGVNGWFTAQQAGVIDINALANQWGYYFQCGKTYNIKLAVKNNCTTWNEVSKTILIRCVEGVDPIRDFYGCCDDIPAIVVGNPNNNPAHTYNWTSNPSFYTTGHTNDISFTTTPYQSTEFFVTVTDAFGCTQENSFLYTLKEDFDTRIKVNKVGCCSYNLTPQVTFIECAETGNEGPMWENIKQNQLTYLWSNGAYTKTINVSPSQNTTYTLTVRNGCYSQTVKVFIEGCPQFSGEFPRLEHPGKIRSNTNNPNHWLKIVNHSLPLTATTPNAYKATRYKLRVWNRWGQLVYDHCEDNCEGFDNGSIYWDGRTNNGVSVQDGDYVFRLTLYNNTYKYNGQNSLCDSPPRTGDPFQFNGGKSNLDWFHAVCTNPPPFWCFWCICNSTWINETTHTLDIIVAN